MARRVIFIWGASRVIQGRWYLGLLGLYKREGMPEDGLAVSLRGLLIWSGLFSILVWFAGAIALFWVWQRNPYSLLTFGDAVLYPVRREVIAEKKGQAFIKEGQDLLRDQKWQDAANLLRLGLARCPQDLRARLSLAQYYVLSNRRSVALRTLEEGIGDRYPGRAYLDFWLNTAELGEDFEVVVRASARFLPQLRIDGPQTEFRWLNERRFAALLAAERPAEALALAESEGAGDTANEHRVMALLALGRAADALVFLAEWRAQTGGGMDRVARLQARALREAGRFDEMARALTELRALLPADPAPLVYAVVQQAMAGRDAPAGAAFDEFLFRFGGSEENLMLIANPLTEIGQVGLLRRCVAAAAERGYPVQPLHRLLVHAHVQRGEWDHAARLLAGFVLEAGRDAAVIAWRDWVLRLADASRTPTEKAQAALLEVLRGRSWSVRTFRQSVAALMQAERWETARDVSAMALGAYPESKWLKKQTVEIARQLAARAVALPAAAAETSTRVAGEKAFVQRLETLLRTEQWHEAARHIQQAEAAFPPYEWLPALEGDIRLAQVRIGQAQRDLSNMRGAARQYLNGDDTRSRQLLELARADFAAGHREFAVALVREILRRSPNLPEVRLVLAEWEPASVEANVLANRRALNEATPNQSGTPAGPSDEPSELLGQIRARHQAGENQPMLFAVRIFLNGDRDRSLQMLELAREFSARGDRPGATALVREVLRKAPGFAPAQRLATEWGMPDPK